MRKFSFPYRHKQIFMIPNRYGFIAVGLFLVFSLVAATYSNNLLFLLAFLHVSFLLVCILQTARNLRHIDLIVQKIPEGFPNETVSAHVLVRNLSRQTKFGLRVRCDRQDTLISELQPLETQSVPVSLTLPAKRGTYSLDRLRLSTESPYGLFWGWLYIKTKWPYYVYPSPTGETLPINTSPQQNGDFSGLREYQTGDPLHRLSWKHSAKNEKWLLKEFKENDSNFYLVNWDQCQQRDPESRLSQLALWLLECEKSQRFYALRLRPTENAFHFQRGTSHLHANLLKLAQWQPPV